jgi:exopolysaccharide production protein ExoQ
LLATALHISSSGKIIMYAASIELQQNSLRRSYVYTGKVVGFLLGELNLFFLLFPFAQFFITFGKWINLTSLTNMISMVLGLMSVAYLFFAAKTFRINWGRAIMLVVMMTVVMLSWFWADPAMKGDSKTVMIRTFFAVIQTLVIVKIFYEKGDEYVFDVLKRFAIIIGIMSGLSIALFPAESSWTIDDSGRKQAFFASPNNLGQFLSFFFLFLNFYKRSSLKWPVVILLNLLIIYQVNGCDSKTSLTGGLICFVLYHLRFLIRPFLIFVICAGMYLPYYTQTFEKGEAEKIEFAKRDMTFTGRSDVWHIMLCDLDEYGRNLTGFGIGGYWGDNHYHPKAHLHELEWAPNSGHNGYLDTKIALGWIGVISLLLFLFQYFTNIFRVLTNRNIVMLFISVIFCINNITETSFFREKHFFFILLMLIFWYTNFKKKETVDAVDEAEATLDPQPVPPIEKGRFRFRRPAF